MFAIQPAGHRYVNRGDPAVQDFLQTDFIIDGNWHPLDISSFIPKGAVLALIRLNHRNEEANIGMDLRTHGNVNIHNKTANHTFVIHIYNGQDALVTPDKNGVIDYMVQVGTSPSIVMSIGGWWI